MFPKKPARFYRKIITIEPGKMGGKPCIRGMRMTVYDVLDYLASGMAKDEILHDFPAPAWLSPRIVSGAWHSCVKLLFDQNVIAMVMPRPGRSSSGLRSRSRGCNR